MGCPSSSQAGGIIAQAMSAAIMLVLKQILELPAVGAVSPDDRIIQTGRGWKESRILLEAMSGMVSHQACSGLCPVES